MTKIRSNILILTLSVLALLGVLAHEEKIDERALAGILGVVVGGVIKDLLAVDKPSPHE